ncbi:MAG: hypothetical protein ABSC56_07815 [Solirubrobacteraceae bacterium]|jgi:hypothetical protein
MRGLVGALAVLLLLTAAASAKQAAPIVLDSAGGCGQDVGDCPPPSAVAYGGWSAWSRADATTGDFELVVRSPAGFISMPAVPERAAPFDVELGPSGSGVVAVYSRCARVASDEGCNVFELPLAVPGATEEELAIPGGGSDHEPAIWHGTLVFLRHNGGARRPDSLVEWRLSSRKPTYLPLPQSHGVTSSPNQQGWPRGLTGVVSGLMLNGSRIAYTTAVSAGDFGMSTLWLAQLGHAPQLIDQVTAGAGNVCDPQFLSPVISGGWLYAYLHDCPAGGGPISDDRFTRYSLSAATAQRADYNFIHYIDDEIFSVVPYDGGAIYDNGVVELLPSLAWRTIPRPIPATFCTRRDPFC